MDNMTKVKKACHNKVGLIICLLFSITILINLSCKKLIETPPPTSSITGANVFSTDATAVAAINNIYIYMNLAGSGNPIQGIRSMSLLAGLSADELTLHKALVGFEWVHYYHNALSAIIQTGSDQWTPICNYIFKCNAAIEALTSSKADALTPVIKQQLLGEAKLLRGYFFFCLVNLFGEMPLCITTDPDVNTMLARSLKQVVYIQILNDLQSAEENLSDKYLNGDLSTVSMERVRPTIWAAKALLAKVFLYMEDYEKAEEKASQVINNTTLFELLPVLNNVFLKNSREAIWQLQPTAINFNTQEAVTLIIPANGPGFNNPVYLSNNLLKSFENGDLRSVYGNWVDTTIYKINSTAFDTVAYAYKYKINASPGVTGIGGLKEYFMLLRLGEQYLIRAEARAQQGKINDAKGDLNAIRHRAGLGDIVASDKNALLTAILHERRVELFTEGANRWFDLKRTGKIDDVMSIVTPQKSNGVTTWQSYQQLYPLPTSELQKAPNLTQNDGY